MPIVVGILLIPVTCVIIYQSNLVTTNKRKRIMLNILLIMTAVLFMVFCLVVNAEPFQFEVNYSVAYMLFSGEFLIEFAVIFVFTPFMWLILLHFLRGLLLSLRIRKNALIRKREDYIYYRDDLDKISPAVIRFAATLEIDLRKSISATLLKLKLMGCIGEKNGAYICRDKAANDLLESEQMVLELAGHRAFDKNRYRKAVEKETLKSRYLTKNRGGILFRIIKILLAACVPVFLIASSVSFDEYVFDNYLVEPANDGYVYFWLGKEGDIEKLYNEVMDINDYYHSPTYYGEDYNYAEIRADRLEYGVVKKAFFLNIFNILYIYLSIASIFFALYRIIEQIVYWNKNYKRTVKGNALVNKAYALKNYLKDFTLIRERTEKELELWEYYLIYAVALDVNVEIEDKIIEKYVSAAM